MFARTMAVISAAMLTGAVLTTSVEAAVGTKIVGVSQSHKKFKNKSYSKVATRKTKRGKVASRRSPAASTATRANVQALIKRMAPSYGVPTWFALRIARIESGYNPYARGGAGELGTFQMKCATAKGIGFRGNCAALLNPTTGVQVGLKHLSIAVRQSRGNLKLAASKHNGGLGRKSLVRVYVNRVF